MLEDRAMGTDDRLNTRYPVNCPKKKKTKIEKGKGLPFEAEQQR